MSKRTGPPKPLTGPQRRALEVLNSKPLRHEWSSAEFAILMWPGHFTQRINGPWGLGPTAAPMACGRMLTRLFRLGYVMPRDHYSAYATYRLLEAGLQALATTRPPAAHRGSGI